MSKLSALRGVFQLLVVAEALRLRREICAAASVFPHPKV